MGPGELKGLYSTFIHSCLPDSPPSSLDLRFNAYRREMMVQSLSLFNQRLSRVVSVWLDGGSVNK